MMMLENLMSPISIAFIIIIVGYYIGRIKVFNISLDLSGVLAVAVFIGWMLSIIQSKYFFDKTEEYQEYMSFFSTFGTAMFVSAIGVSTGNLLNFHKKSDIKAMLIGAFMAVSAFAVMKIISVTDNNISTSKLLGSLCGALTSTPGLSVACELKNVVQQEVILGYGYTYLFGVILTVLFVQAISVKTSDTEYKKSNDCISNAALGGLVQIGGTVVLGRLIGSVEIANFSIGNSGGMLLAGIIVGIIVKKYFKNSVLTNKQLMSFRNMGLVLFFVGNGIPAGMRIVNGFDLKMILYGVLMTIIPIISGALLYKIFYKKGTAASVIAGGMTSTPAIGVLAGKCKKISLIEYSLAYFGALITIIFIIRVC